jgi:hypothetical protein
LSFDTGDTFLGLDLLHYPQTCFSSFPDRPNHRLVAWVDDYAYRDAGQSPHDTYCTGLDDPNCHPQPGQPHGEVTVTLYGHRNNVVAIPLEP